VANARAIALEGAEKIDAAHVPIGANASFETKGPRRRTLHDKDRGRPAQRRFQPGCIGPASSGPETDGDRVVIPPDGSMDLDGMESCIIQARAARNHRNLMATAESIGTTREMLRYRIQKYGLRLRRQDGPDFG
jgi:hypothetical protein